MHAGDPKLSHDEQIVGGYSYRGLAAMTFHRLTLELGGKFKFDDWRALRGKWDLRANGKYTVHSDKVFIDTGRRRAYALIEYPLGIRTVNGRTILVPQRYLDEFDRTGGRGSESRAATTSSFAEGYNLFLKEPLPRAVTCLEPREYAHALTRGKRYLVLEEHSDRHILRLFGDHGRLRWFPCVCFNDSDRGDNVRGE